MLESVKLTSPLQKTFSLWLPRVLLLLAFAGMMITLIYRRDNFDDAWFGELAYFLANEGIIRSNLFADYLGWGDRVLMTHKLWVVLTALWIKIWGFSLYTVKTVALPFVLVQVYLFYRNAPGSWLLTSLLYLTCGVIVRYTFVSRPEVAMATFGFLSWYGLQQFRERKRLRWLLLASVSAGVTALFHLQGAIFMSAGALWLIWCKDYRGMLVYSAVSFLTFLVYFTDVLVYDAWEAYFFQIANDPGTGALRNLPQKFYNLTEIPKMMLHSLGEIPTTLLTLGCLVLRRISGLKCSDLEKYLLLLAICFIILANQVFHHYFILFIPFMLTYCVETLYRVDSLSRQPSPELWFPKTRRWITALVILHFVSGFMYDGKLLIRNLRAEPLSARNSRLQAILGDEPKTVIAPQSFIFDNIEQLHIIGLIYYFHYNSHHSETLTPQLFFEDAQRKGVEAVILEKNPVTTEYEPPAGLPEEINGYQLIYRDELYRIFRIQRMNKSLKPVSN